MAVARRILRPPEPNLSPPGEAELPYDFGPPLESQQHLDTLTDLVTSLRDWLREQGDTTTYVNGNMALYFSLRQVKHNDFLGPDVMVVKDTTLRTRKSWVCWEEERTPSVVIELLSESTEARDRGEKMAIYARSLRTPDYFLFDPIDGRLEGYRLDPKAHTYVVLNPDADEAVACEELGLRLGVVWEEVGDDQVVPHLRWREPSGAWVPTRAERIARTGEQAARAIRESAEAAAVALASQAEAAEAKAVAANAQARAAEAQAQAAEAQAKEARAQAQAAENQAKAERLAARLRALGLDPEAP